MQNNEKPKYVTWKRLASGEMDLISFNLSDEADDVVFELRSLESVHSEMNSEIDKILNDFLQAVITPGTDPKELLLEWAKTRLSKINNEEYIKFLHLVVKMDKIKY